ncbi:hypothetical protein [Agromyces sp. SYSU T00194]|uniref:hypothetical protein n=1 Tax=Agromyces chitinivorans TaxID=3158560 RepID=UPI003393E9F8
MAAAGLSAGVLALIQRVVEPLDASAARSLVRQAESARVIRLLPTMVDVEVPPCAERVNLPDGPAPVEAFVLIGDVIVGEVLLWLRGGRLIGLEQAWYTDETPRVWPAPTHLHVSPK